MSEPITDAAGLFDPENAISSHALNGKRGVIVKAEARRHSYGKADIPETCALFLTVYVEEFAKLRTEIYGIGNDYYPSDKFQGQPSAVGPFVVGSKGLPKNSNTTLFLSELKTAGFPFEKMSAGFKGLEGADVTFKSVDRKVGSGTKAYAVVAEYHGQKEVTKEMLAHGLEEIHDEAPTDAPAHTPADDATIRAATATALKAALKENGGEIPRGQLSIRVQKELNKTANGTIDKPKALALLTKDEFFASVEGVSFDAKTVKLSA